MIIVIVKKAKEKRLSWLALSFGRVYINTQRFKIQQTFINYYLLLFVCKEQRKTARMTMMMIKKYGHLLLLQTDFCLLMITRRVKDVFWLARPNAVAYWVSFKWLLSLFSPPLTKQEAFTHQLTSLYILCKRVKILKKLLLLPSSSLSSSTLVIGQ